MKVGKRSFPNYSHRNSRQDFTLYQLFAILVLRQMFKTDYRGIVAIVRDGSDIREDLDLNKVPHFTTLQKAERKLFSADRVRRLISPTVGLHHGEDHPQNDASYRIEQVAADGTGFETHQASRYFVRRRSRDPSNPWQTTSYRDFAKLILAVDCASHLILATHRGKGPCPDLGQLDDLLAGWCDNAVPEQLLADAGFDSAHNHKTLRSMGMESIIPAAIGRPTDNLPTDPWRYLMATDFDGESYGQRWQSETVMFMLKQHFGEALTARKYHTRRSAVSSRSNRREIALRCITHNIMILYVQRAFLQGTPDPFSANQRLPPPLLPPPITRFPWFLLFRSPIEPNGGITLRSPVGRLRPRPGLPPYTTSVVSPVWSAYMRLYHPSWAMSWSCVPRSVMRPASMTAICVA